MALNILVLFCIARLPGAAGGREEFGAVPPQDRGDTPDAHAGKRGFLRGERDARGHQAERLGGAAELRDREGEVVDRGAGSCVCRGQHRRHRRRCIKACVLQEHALKSWLRSQLFVSRKLFMVDSLLWRSNTDTALIATAVV